MSEVNKKVTIVSGAICLTVILEENDTFASVFNKAGIPFNKEKELPHVRTDIFDEGAFFEWDDSPSPDYFIQKGPLPVSFKKRIT
ncbi:MAG: hypothetical protein ABIH38_00530 [Patescibacteria group bacterium]